MKFIFSIIKKHLKHEFNLWAFFLSLALSGLIIYADNLLSIEASFSSKYAYSKWIYLYELIKNLTAYWSAILILILAGKTNIKKFKKFALISSLGIAIYSLYTGFYEFSYIVNKTAFPCKYFLHYLFKYLSGIFTLVLPLFIVYKLFKSSFEKGFFGLNFKNLSFTRYLDILVIIVVVMFFAVNLPEIKGYYPILNSSYYRLCAYHLNISKWITASIFELVYLTDFVWVELFFRGFLVIGMIRFLGKDAILPMAVLYVVIHLGKPMPEVISSFFGGYLLGVIAYQTKNIRAGILMHIVLAFSAEIFTYS